MIAGVRPSLETPEPRPARRPQPSPAEPLRLPEERAFEVATINRRLARMAELASPAARR